MFSDCYICFMLLTDVILLSIGELFKKSFGVEGEIIVMMRMK